MIFYLIGFFIFISVFLVVRHKKNFIVETFLNGLKKEISGTLIKGGLFLNPRLDVLFDGKHIVISSMVSGARVGGSAGRQAIWYAMAKLENKQVLSFQLAMKQKKEIDVSLKSVYISGDPGFDEIFKIYINQESSALFMKIFDADIRLRFIKMVDAYPGLRVNFVNNILDVSVPSSVIKSGGELKGVAIFLAELIDKFEKANFVDDNLRGSR